MSNDTEATYAVYCFYKESKPKEWIADGLTKEEAQAMCRTSRPVTVRDFKLLALP